MLSSDFPPALVSLKFYFQGLGEYLRAWVKSSEIKKNDHSYNAPVAWWM